MVPVKVKFVIAVIRKESKSTLYAKKKQQTNTNCLKK